MALVLVVAGANRGVFGTQVERKRGIAFEVHAAGIPIERHEGEHAAPHLEHGDAIAEGVVFDRSGKTSAKFENVVSCHVGNSLVAVPRIALRGGRSYGVRVDDRGSHELKGVPDPCPGYRIEEIRVAVYAGCAATGAMSMAICRECC